MFFTGLFRFRHTAALASASLVLGIAACEEPADIPPGGQASVGGVRVLWRTPLAEGAHLHAPTTDGARFYSEGNRRVEAYALTTGARTWSERPDFRTAPANYLVRDGKVLGVGSRAVALDVSSGREVWQFTPDTTAALAESAADERALYFGTMSHRVYALNHADGSLIWSTDVGPEWQHRGIIRGVSVSGDTVYAGVDQHVTPNGERSIGWIFALERATGRVLWSYQNGTGQDQRYIGSAPRVVGRLLLAVDYPQNTFIAVDRFTGQEVWRTAGIPSYAGADEAPVVSGDTAYAASHDQYVYAMALQTGHVLWKTRMPAGNRALAICGNRLLANYLGLAVLDRQSGQLLGTGLNDYAQNDFPTTGFAVAGNRAFVSGEKAAYGLECP
jgi:outer membrane protein assembly factor BamB